jgi:hypothetical protein
MEITYIQWFIMESSVCDFASDQHYEAILVIKSYRSWVKLYLSFENRKMNTLSISLTHAITVVNICIRNS